MTIKQVVIAISASLAQWVATQRPNAEVETTLFEEISSEDDGLVLSVDDEEFEIRVKRAGE